MDASIVVPVHNSESTINDCINALLKQDYSGNYEVIVVDDGSKDNTRESVEKFGAVKLVSQEKKGPAAARNLGARNAKGKAICFIDSDCIAEKNWLSEITKPLGSGIVGVQGAYTMKQPEIIARFEQLEIEKRYEKMKQAKYIDHIGTYSAAYDRNVFLENNGFDESFPLASGEDIEFSFRLASKGSKMVFNPNARVEHTHPESFPQYLKTKFMRGYYRVLLYRKHSGKTINDSYTPQTIKLQIGFFYLLPILIAAGLVLTPVGLYLAAIDLALILITSIPFTLFALRKDFLVGALSPIIITLRTAVLALGFALGIVANAIGK